MLGKKKTLIKRKVGLCLGGGGARGFAEIGALKAFEENGINFDVCVGTSVGAFVGAIYCAALPYEYVRHEIEKLEMSDFHGKFLIKPEQPTRIAALVKRYIGDCNIEELKIKFACVATDLIAAKQAILDSGDLATAISASCAVPLVYSPVIYKGMHLIDGGLTNNIPADVCKMLGADKVVAIDVNPTRALGTDKVGLFDVLKTVFNIMNANASINGKISADVFIPMDTSAFKSTSKSGYAQMIDLGYNAVMRHMDEIKNLFNGEE